MLLSDFTSPSLPPTSITFVWQTFLQGLSFSILDCCTCRAAELYTTSAHRKAIELHYVPNTPPHRQKTTKTNRGLHSSMKLQGIPSVNMTQGMTELEVGNAVPHSEP